MRIRLSVVAATMVVFMLAAGYAMVPHDRASTRVSAPDEATSELLAVSPAPTGISPLAEATIPVPVPTAVAVPQPPRLPSPREDAQMARIVIPKAKVDNHPVTRGLTDKRQMEDPGGRDDVAWYNFSGRPGFGSNAVFSGHVDWYTGDRGSFWFLRDLKEGDEAIIEYTDGLSLTYRVIKVNVYNANDAPVAEITGPTSKDVITMITCDGVFQRASHDYDQRRVVVAERVS